MTSRIRMACAPIQLARLVFLIVASVPVTGFAGNDNVLEAFTEPYRDIDVAAAEMGVIAQIHVKEGERVQAGQLLAQLDDSVLRASLDILKSEAESRGRIESVTAELEMQSDLLTKLEGLLDKHHASSLEVARAGTQKKVLAARVKSAQEELVVKNYELRRLEMQLQQRRIVSPIAGIVTRLAKEPGEFVSPSDPVTAKVVQLDPLAVVFSVPVGAASQLKVGSTVNVNLGTLGTQAAELEFVSPTADAQSGTTRVRVKLPNPGEKIACGIPCQLVLTTVTPAAPPTKPTPPAIPAPNQQTRR